MEYYNNAIELINQESVGMREDFEKEINEKDLKIESLNAKISELERENRDILNNKSSMKNKVGSLENQLDENKKLISEVQIKFDNILNNHISKANSEKEKIKEEYELKLRQMEQRYEVLIQEMQEDYEKTMFDMRKENEDLEEELNSLSKQTQANMKASDPKIINEKITEMLSIQNNLRKELDMVKYDREKKTAELSSKYEREKELQNLKILDLELAVKEYEHLGFNKNNGLSTNNSNRGSALFGNIEHEKEKIKWNNERDSFKKNVGDLNSKIERMENKIESLLRENESLRLTYIEEHHSPIYPCRNANTNNNNSFIKKNSRSNSMIGMNNLDNNINNFNNNSNNLMNKKHPFNLNMHMNMSSPIGKQEPNLFSDNSEIGEYNICYDITSPQVNISLEKKDYFNINSDYKIHTKYGNGCNNMNNFPGNKIKK